MDPISTAIIAAVAAGAAKGATDVATSAIVDAYQGFKALLKKRFGDRSDVVEAVEKLEDHPESAGRRQTLTEELTGVKAGDDAELVEAARKLLEQIKTQPGGERHIQMARGTGIAQADRGSTATVNIQNRKDE